MVSADESPFAENDLMDPLHVPQSIAVATFRLVETLATWPLRHSVLWTVYRQLRDRKDVDESRLPTEAFEPVPDSVEPDHSGQ
jgi:hypothetical protein